MQSERRDTDEFDLDSPQMEAADSEQTLREPAEEDSGSGGSQEVEEMRDRYLRLAAEFDNYRKRTERERTEGRDRAQAQVIERLLEPLDDLQRVAQFSAEGTTVDALLEGVRMVERKLSRVLESLGLEPMDPRGKPFNPEEHEALMTAPAEDESEDETVGEVFQSGYRFRGSLIRPARVQVRKHG